MRIRVRYEKSGKLRFISAIDLGRVWERALRKADLPIAYSEGFSPHPKVSFADALPLGYASTGEYAELTFAAEIPIEPAMQALNTAFPAGIKILSVQEAPEGAAKMAKRLQASYWQLSYPADVAPQRLAAAVAVAQAASSLPVNRERKGEVSTVDLRPALHGIAADGLHVRAVLLNVEPAVRPTELHLAISGEDTGTTELPEPALVTRIAQGIGVPDGLEEALFGGLVPLEPREDAELEDFDAVKKAIS